MKKIVLVLGFFALLSKFGIDWAYEKSWVATGVVFVVLSFGLLVSEISKQQKALAPIYVGGARNKRRGIW
jgi:hypothetical protein